MSGKKHKSNRSRTRQFTGDLKSMLFAFGDCSSPNIDTINFLEDVLCSYLIDVIMEANKHRNMVNRNKFRIEDLKFALRRDPVKLGRVVDLAMMDRVISKAKRQFDDLDGSKPKPNKGAEGDEFASGKRKHEGGGFEDDNEDDADDDTTAKKPPAKKYKKKVKV